MIILFYFIYHIFKKFPILILFVYVVQIGIEDAAVKNKFEEKEEIEVSEYLTELEAIITKAQNIVDFQVESDIQFVLYVSKLFPQKFILTSYHKLYILYSQLIIGMLKPTISVLN